jgi:predicted nuclease of restriction endonuclease-like (RecB) superfamily
MKPEQTISFEFIVSSIVEADKELSLQATRAVNVSLTLRNWLIGLYIAEFEFRGADRAQYAEKLLSALSERLAKANLSRVEVRELQRYRRFYAIYPQVMETINSELKSRLALLEAQSRIAETVSPQLRVPIQEIITKLSFSQIIELLSMDDPVKRTFYELQSIRGNWSVRELRRQIGSLFFERTALSSDMKKMVVMAQATAEQASPKLEIRDPYIFEFLGLKPNETVTENLMEHSLIGKLEDFILELGNGFCFEARQKRILIGDQTYFVDLVFYHRILKCHVLIELKLGKFTHEHIGQLNTYVTWFKRHMMVDGDNPPVGLLLCNEKDHALVEYALAGLDNDLFVSKYLLELPSKEVIQRFLTETLKEQS